MLLEQPPYAPTVRLRWDCDVCRGDGARLCKPGRVACPECFASAEALYPSCHTLPRLFENIAANGHAQRVVRYGMVRPYSTSSRATPPRRTYALLPRQWSAALRRDASCCCPMPQRVARSGNPGHHPRLRILGSTVTAGRFSSLNLPVSHLTRNTFGGTSLVLTPFQRSPSHTHLSPVSNDRVPVTRCRWNANRSSAQFAFHFKCGVCIACSLGSCGCFSNMFY